MEKAQRQKKVIRRRRATMTDNFISNKAFGKRRYQARFKPKTASKRPILGQNITYKAIKYI